MKGFFGIKFFDQHNVNIKNDNYNKANFGNTLSESDKRLLAFAFFLASLSLDRDLDKKIIVLDDPMSSFDIERRRKTIHLITDISCEYNQPDGTGKSLRPKQKIILTHEDRFAKELSRRMENACTLKIEDCGNSEQKRSKISRAEFSKDFPDDNISFLIERVKGILDNRKFNEQFEKDCRIVLEHIFKRKYYLELKKSIGEKRSVRAFIGELKALEVGRFEDSNKYNMFDRLCDDLNIDMHDNDSHRSSGDSESILKEFFECLKEI